MKRRAIQAEQTRAVILASARLRFAENGYAATSLKVIAADAGVSVQTLYDSVGSKADLVRALNDLIDEEAAIGEVARDARSQDPAIVADIPGRITRRILERCGDIVRSCYDAARAEPELAAVAEEGSRRHRDGTNRVASRLSDLGALPPSVSPDEAARMIAILTDPRVGFILLDEHGLDLDGMESWMRSALRGWLSID